MTASLKILLQQSLQALDIHDVSIALQTPENPEHGDYACNIAMQLVKVLKKNPRVIAQDIIDALPKNTVIQKVEIAGPGFLNFFFSTEFFADQLKNTLAAGENFGKNTLLEGKKFIAEHTDPNLFKEVHIGHVMTNTIGESMYRIAGFCAADTKNVTFQGDVGLHIAKALWGMKNIGEELPMEVSVYEKQKFLGKCYVFGEKNFSDESNPQAKKEILVINKKVYNREDTDQNALYDMGCQWSLEYLETIYALLGSQFDHYFLESQTFADGKRLVEENTGENGKKVFIPSNRAVIFEGSKHGFHDRVFINSEGLPTYEAKDIGLFYTKWKKYSPDLSLTVTGGDQDQYFKTVREAAGLINPDWKAKTSHIAHGVLQLTTGKMSSRTGDIVRAQDWIDSAREYLIDKMANRDIEENEKKYTAQKIAIGAIKYSILKVSAGKNIVYDQETALDFTGNSGPYLQYSYVRAQSIVRKIENTSESGTCVFDSAQTPVPDTERSRSARVFSIHISPFEKLLHHFPQTVKKSFTSASSHHIASYLYTLCKAFNSFYAHTKILDTTNPEYKKNIQLVQVFSIVIKNGLYLLGIETVEKM